MVGVKFAELYNKVRKQIEDGKMKEAHVVVKIDSSYDADDISDAIHYAMYSLLSSWFDKPGHEADAVDARPVRVDVCVRDSCSMTWIYVNSSLSDYEIEKLINALAKLINILAPSLTLTEEAIA